MQQKETVALLRRIPGAELVIFGGRLYAILSLQITLRAALRFSLSTWQAQVLGRSRNGGLGSYEAGLAFFTTIADNSAWRSGQNCRPDMGDPVQFLR